MIGSDVGKRVGDELKSMVCPFTGETVVLLPALNPDVALIHVQRCDAYGNAQLDGLQFMDIDMAMAANRVILTTERIVSNDQIRRSPDRTQHSVLHRGSGGRSADRLRSARVLRDVRAFLQPARRLCGAHSKDPVRGMRQYLEEYYYGPKSWADYLAKIGMDEVLDACRRGRSVHND